MTAKNRAVTGTHTENGRPRGHSSLTPHLVVSPAGQAIAFYREVFEAELVDETHFGELVAHATLALPLGRFTVSDPLPEYDLVAPAGGPLSMTLAIYVPDVDVVAERALARGAKLREPVSDFASGDRYASILDPFGVRWAVMTRVEDLSPEESAERVRTWAASQAG
ncbi:MAG: Glyoxalase/bleomycin resistance protein/dioxygenase [Polyangiaceae bacterium]|jgi:PhnB protein|nr:Glyoxalase/bleomycin resistance protein/dioxygenase [Polyangiaceae bacterium]